VRYQELDRPGISAWRIVVNTPNGTMLEAIIATRAGAELSTFQARTIWKNERRLFRRFDESSGAVPQKEKP